MDTGLTGVVCSSAHNALPRRRDAHIQRQRIVAQPLTLQAQGGARGHGLDGGGVLQRAGHALPRRRDAHIQR